MSDQDSSRWNQMLDLLADEVAARLAARQAKQAAGSEPATPADLPKPAGVSVPSSVSPPRVSVAAEQRAEPASSESPVPHHPLAPGASAKSTQPLHPGPQPAPTAAPAVQPPVQPERENSTPPPSHAASMLSRLGFGMLLIVILINIPFNAQGTALARSVPNSAALVIANGLVVKEETSPDIYVYRDGAFHWITSLDAFERYGYRWKDVHAVESGFLDEFAKGKPVYVLLKCSGNPHIYLAEAGSKRWIVDIPTFEAQGYVWQDVQTVSCSYLRDFPDGDSIPPGRGTPPAPRP